MFKHRFLIDTAVPREELISMMVRYPRKRLCFFTIKDNSHQTVWNKLGKCSDWIRRYSNIYYLVRGTNNGIHFHGLAVIKDDCKQLRFPKGIHFDVQYMTKDRCHMTTDELVEQQEEQDQRYGRQHRDDAYYQQGLTAEQRDCLSLICYSIQQYFSSSKKRSANNSARRRNITKKRKDIGVVFDYLAKNLAEPRSGRAVRYTDYQYLCM